MSVASDSTTAVRPARVGVAAPGPWPGTDPVGALRDVLDVLGAAPADVQGHPCLMVLPARGPAGAVVGRALALAEGLAVGLEPYGWRLRATADGEARRARAYLRDDLDALAAAADGYAGPLVLPALGPWSLAAAVWLPRGERAVTDPVATDDLAASIVAGVAAHVADVRRRVPGARPVVLLAEGRLEAVLAGALPTFSGLATTAPVDPATVREVLRRCVSALGDVTGCDVVVQLPATVSAVTAAVPCGARGLALDLVPGPDALWEQVAAAVESGTALWAGLVPVEAPPNGDGGAAGGAAEGFARTWDALGLEPRRLRQVVVTPRSGLSGASPARAREALRAVVDVGRRLAERGQA